MVKRLIGVFERKMTDQELAHFQSVCTMQKIMPVVDQKYDVLLWWLRATDQKLSNSQPCMYEFQDAPNISVIYLQKVRLMATYHLRAVDLEKLKSLKALANGLSNDMRYFSLIDLRGCCHNVDTINPVTHRSSDRSTKNKSKGDRFHVV